MGPNEVKVNQSKIDDLTTLYKVAAETIGTVILLAFTARIRSRAGVQANVRQVTTQLNADVSAWVDKNMPGYYLSGANDAMQALRAADAELSVTKMTDADKQALQAMLDQTKTALTEASAGMARSAGNIIADGVKQQLNFIVADGRLNSESLQTVKTRIEQTLKENGITALKDKAGKSWSADSYSEMFARTEAVAMRNEGLSNRMLANGFDLVEVSTNGSDHPACEEWEGQILSLTGQTDGYPTVEDATDAGLFHPNCQHAINPVDPSEYGDYYDNPDDYAAAADAIAAEE